MSDATLFGMGYVGTVLAVGLARRGKNVVGVETSAAKRTAFAAGKLPFREPGLDEAFAACRERIQIVAEPGTLSPVTLICVGTPRDPATGGCDARAVLSCLRQIAVLKQDTLVLIRSTVWPGLWDELKAAAGRVPLGVHPEFMREGSSLADFDHPTLHVIGLDGDEAPVRRLYDFVTTPLTKVPPKSAMLLKYACNGFHALKIAFANEIDAAASRLGVDGTRLMELFRRDDRLNASAAYLRPGLPFGGSCLPKDVAQIESWAAGALPLLGRLLESNRARLAGYVAALSRYKRIAIVGLAFKPGLDDLRGSPLVELVRTLKGVRITGIDDALVRDRLVDANRALLDELTALPHFELRDDFRGDEEAVFFSFDSSLTRRLVERAPGRAYALFAPPHDLPLTELKP